MTLIHVNNSVVYSVVLYLLTLSTCYALSSNDSTNNDKSSQDKTSSNVSKNTMTQPIESITSLSEFEQKIAAKMALDIRYFCSESEKRQKKLCLTPVTKLPTELTQLITNSGVGGVVLFAENLESTNQIIQLTHDLQQAAIQSKSGQPLIISIDQEGGRVVRLPQATSFAGNMAIGATYSEHGTSYATDTSTIIAKELKLLGINNNYAPVIDVNTNPNNPVINTRSFGENPQNVAKLGVAAVKGYQAQGIMATLKHFPGHGDTHVDSHLGLPLVEHSLQTIEKNDIAPFQWAINHSAPAMIMTAHIQYPALDNSTIKNNMGEDLIRPATMSRKILTQLLRNKMGFEGLIATDALDMAGITHYFDDVTAVVETFVAGADIAVMPFKIRVKEDVYKFYDFIKQVAKAINHKVSEIDRSNAQRFSLTEIDQSVERINHYKTTFIRLSTLKISEQITNAEQHIAQSKYLKLEQDLASNALVLLTNKLNILPIEPETITRIHLFVLNWQEFSALKHAVTTLFQNMGKIAPQISATVVAELDAQTQIKSGDKLTKADILIATIDTKIASVVDIGGAEDLHTQDHLAIEKDKVSYQQLLVEQLSHSKQKKVPSILIVKGSPYLLEHYKELANAIILTFDDRIYQKDLKTPYSPGYQTSVDIVFGKQSARGKLPVSLSVK